MRIALMQLYSYVPTPDYDQIARGLRALGHIVWIAQPNESGDIDWNDGSGIVATLRGPAAERDSVFMLPGLRMMLRRLNYYRSNLRLRRFLKGARFDVVQINPWLGSWILAAGAPMHTLYVLDIRQAGITARSAWEAIFRDRLARLKWILQSKYIFGRTCFLDEYGAQRVLGPNWSRWATVVPLGVSPEFRSFSWGCSANRLSSGIVRFVYIGTLDKMRKLETILIAAQSVFRETDRFEVVLIGPDTSNGYYLKLIQELGISGAVSIWPPVRYADIPSILADFDVALAVVPDAPAWRYQPTLKVLEYRALGMPIIATDLQPNRRIVLDGVNGVIVKDSPESLANGMRRFVAEAGFLDSCTARARVMRESKSWIDVARDYEENVYGCGRCHEAGLVQSV